MDNELLLRQETDRPGCEDKDKEKAACSAIGYQDVNVCIPITIKPFGEAGNAVTKCLGNAIVSTGCDICPGKSCDVCKFTISQKLRVEVPVIFGARAEIGDAAVNCGYTNSSCDCDIHFE